MSKLNHNRPSLRYLDNFRREARVEQRRSFWIDNNIEKLAQQAVKRSRLDEHICVFELFDPNVQASLERLITSFSVAQDALHAVISTTVGGGKGRHKAARARSEEAHEQVVVSGAMFLHQNFDDMLAGKSAAWDWLRGFHPILKSHARRSWMDLLSIVFEESLPLCLAEKIGSTMEEIEHLRSIFTEAKAA